MGYTYEGEIPVLPGLKQSVCEAFKGLVKEGSRLEIAKYINYNFSWLHLSRKYLEQESMKQASKGKKKKKQEIDPASYSIEKLDIRKMPVLLKDGDVFGVMEIAEEEEKELDFQTDEDQARKK